MKTAYTLLGALLLTTASFTMLQAAPVTTPGAPINANPATPPTTANPTPGSPSRPITPPPTYYNQVPVYTNQAPRSPDVPRQSAPMQQ